MPPNDPASDAAADNDVTDTSGALSGRRVLVCVTGGIAAYKTCYVVSALAQRGAEVTCAMTRAATKFVGPLTFEALSGREVLTSRWRSRSHDPQHIHLAESAEVVLVAPATANTIAKLATGLADDLVSTLMLVVRCPVLIAPSMNDRMWTHPTVQRNIETLKTDGHKIIGPAEGWMACRSIGIGRMAEPDQIVAEVEATLKSAQ